MKLSKKLSVSLVAILLIMTTLMMPAFANEKVTNEETTIQTGEIQPRIAVTVYHEEWVNYSVGEYIPTDIYRQGWRKHRNAPSP